MVAMGHKDVVFAILLTKEADIKGHKRCWYGTPLQAAEQEGHEAIIEMLRKAEQDADKSPRVFSLRRGKIEWRWGIN